MDVTAIVISRSPLPAPDTMGTAFEALVELRVIDDELASRMKAAVGFRDIVIHSYQNIDWKIVHRLCVDSLDDFRRLAANVERALAE